MDPELQKRIDAARAQGYSDEEIQQVLGSDAGKSAQPEATMPGGYNVPILSAEEKAKFQQSQQQTEAANSGENLETGLVTAGMGAAAVGVPAALLYGAKAVLSPAKENVAKTVTQGMNLAQQGVNAMNMQGLVSQHAAEAVNDRALVKTGQMTAGEAASRAAAREATMQSARGQSVGKVSPVVPGPGTMAGATPTTPMGPVNPATAPQASMMSRVQAAAANKIQNLPGANMMGSAGRMAGKLLPGVGTAVNAVDAYNRAQEGDYLGAGIAGVGAAASPFPVVGTAVGMGTGALNAYRDYLKRQEEEKKRMMQ